MKTRINTLHPEILHKLVGENSSIFISDNFAFFRDMQSIATQPMLEMVRTPQYVEIGRLVRVTTGTAVFRINLIPFILKTNDVLAIPENTYIEITDVSADFNAQGVSFHNLPISFSRCTLLHLNEQDFLRTGKYLDLIWEVLHKETFSMKTIEFLQSALLNDLKHIHQKTGKKSVLKLSRGEKIMQKFLNLVAEFGSNQRRVKFYADQLTLTPNHLSAVVREQSKQTVMQWLNERTILQAKVLLKHSDMSNSEIAFQLGFNEATLFSRFFRRETGMSPKEYRKRIP